MPDMKARDVVKGAVKTIDKSAVAAKRIKEAYIRTKEKTEHDVYSAESSPDEYAADRLSGGMATVPYEIAHQLDKQGRKGVKATKENIEKVKERFKRERTTNLLKKQAEKRTGDVVQQTGNTASRAANIVQRSTDTARNGVKTIQREQKAVKTFNRGKKTIKQTTKSTGKAMTKAAKGTPKTVQRSVKTAEQTAKVTLRTSRQAAKAAQRTAQATARAAKVTVKATIAAAKTIAAVTKALIAAIAAGGWVVVVVIILICLIGLIVGSCFGIFFSGEDTGTGQTMQTVVREINEDYQSQLDTIKANISYDVLEMSGSRAVWPEVLAVYAVKTTTDPDNAQEVASMDDPKKAILKDIFWQMNTISSHTETAIETVVEETDDGNGNIVETATTVTRTTLYITVSHKTAEEMADCFHFNADQRQQLAELLAEGNSGMWRAVLYGISADAGGFSAVALSQIGNVGDIIEQLLKGDSESKHCPLSYITMQCQIRLLDLVSLPVDNKCSISTYE